ncbi:hypothetical protein [Hyphomicrobium sp. DY-1]|uniref:hypothetical protein n=1 Tax=Hyphomicrobium sp. DY-1 TaxID=3075650 RepID=UPI0039C0845A
MVKAAVYAGPAEHQQLHSKAMASGLGRHGIEVQFYRSNETVKNADFFVTWGWRTGSLIRARGRDVLVMERSYIGDRFSQTSLGWNGLNGRATWAPDTGKSIERFDKNFRHLVKPWRWNDNGYALIIGQVPGDMATAEIDMKAWYGAAAKTMKARGFEIKFRPHPLAGNLTSQVLPSCRLGAVSLEKAFAGAAVVVTANSNAGVDAALAGIPTIVCDSGSMAEPVAAFGLEANLVTPDREDWFRSIAYRQWALPEIESGEAFDHVRQAIPGLAANYAGNSPLPRPKRCLVLGGGASVWTDAEAALDLAEFDFVIAANDIGAHWAGKIDVFCSLHPEKLEGWIRARREKGHPDGFTTWAHKKIAGCPVDRATSDWKGSSGLFAVKIARELGYERIVLCGVPMSAEGAHFFDDNPWDASKTFRQAWINRRAEIAPYVRSMSGWSRSMLGEPSSDWLAA